MSSGSVGYLEMVNIGATYRQIDYWTRRGFLQPEPGPAGSGHVRYWPASERDIAAAMVRLVKAGIPPRIAHAVARAGGDHQLDAGIRIVVTDPSVPRP